MDNSVQQKSDSTQFDVKQFNINFDALKSKIRENNNIIDEKTLSQLDKKDNLPKIPIYLQNPETIIFNVKQTWFDIYDDLNKYGFQIQILDKGDRMFYLGLTLIFFALTLYAIYVLFDFDDDVNNKEKIVIEKHFYYK